LGTDHGLQQGRMDIMAIEHSIWKICNHPEKLQQVKMDNEDLLEDLIFKDISILSDGWMLIGRQVRTDYDKRIDLLAIDASGSLIIIELKRHKTPRDVVAQTIDYASWILNLEADKIAKIYSDFCNQLSLPNISLDEAFEQRFGAPLSEEDLNSSHQMVVVASELDASTERIIQYLNDHANVAVNAVFFKVFRDGGNQYLSRAWMIDPGESQEKAVVTGKREEWNGEYYASFGIFDNGRNWEDAVKYGFISAGGGRWYSKTLFKLSPGDRVWVNIPKTGYVGVAEVLDAPIVSDEFEVIVDGKKKLFLEIEKNGNYPTRKEKGEDKAEYLVPVKWIKAVSKKDAVDEVGLFGNQNSVAQPRTPKWSHTIERLKAIWKIA
jgi:hypothetical protein